MKIRFYKDSDNRWYADLPDYIEDGGTKEDLEMVCGADTWLDIISQSREIDIELSDKPIDNSEVLTIDKYDDGFPEHGAYYRIGNFNGKSYSNMILWLCPVTLFVFGYYPPKIYYKL